MNPTAKNISATKTWKGIKAPRISTKNIWNMFHQLWFFDKQFIDEILSKKPSDRDYAFAEKVYKKVTDNGIYITNLSKATQVDARPLHNDVFKKYLDVFHQEITLVQPEVIITFGNQVSSVLLDKNIQVGAYRKKHEVLEVHWKKYKVFPVYYPVWQGMRNMKIAQEDIAWIMWQ